MSLARQRLTAAEYLAIEREADHKSEFFDGTMFAMAGASRQHGQILTNIVRRLDTQFDGRACQVFASDMRVKVSKSGLYTYPDVVAFCGQGLYEDERTDTLLNPSLIIEVLSPSTEAYDRGTKFGQYRQIGTLTDYLMIAQNQVRVEHYVRQGGIHWSFSDHTEVDGRVEILSLRCELLISDLYRKVEFSS